MRLWVVLLAIAALTCARTLPPKGQALVMIDTDAAPGTLAGELRVDVYREGSTEPGITHAARLADIVDWPASFGIYDPDEQADRVAIVRIRIAPLGRSVLEPRLAIDRLVRTQLKPGIVGSLRVVLHGACFGVEADLAKLQSCIDTEGQLANVETIALDPDLSPRPREPKTFGKQTCAATVRPASPLLDEEICVDGGAFVFGNLDEFGNVVSGAPAPLVAGLGNAVPERVVRVDAFRMDKYEVTVGRWRDAIARGFVPPVAPIDNPTFDPMASPNDLSQVNRLCTWSRIPMGREMFPMNCMSWDTARAFCQFAQADLPGEAQWEWAAQSAGRDRETFYAWGDTTPACNGAIFGRTISPRNQCTSDGWGPQAENDPRADQNKIGIVNLGGSMIEWSGDSFGEMDDPCWTMSISNPRCVKDASSVFVSLRGAGWSTSSYDLPASRRGFEHHGAYTPHIGFRCVRGIR